MLTSDGSHVCQNRADMGHQASVITNATGATIEAESDYYPHGGERVVATDTTGNQYKFTGKERDVETGLDYFGARYYMSAQSRWITPDWSATPVPVPYADLHNPQTLNLYPYVANSPVTKADLDGHDAAVTGGMAGCFSCTIPVMTNDGGPAPVSIAMGLDMNSPSAEEQRYIAQVGQARNQTGTVNILGQTVPYTIAHGAPTTALATLNKIVSTINGAQDKLTQAQVTEIKAVKEIYIAATLGLSNGGLSVTNSAVQGAVSQQEHINVPVGTYVMNGANLSRASTGYWASSFVHEGVHMIHREFGTPANERRAYFEQYRSMPPFHVKRSEGDFVKHECGANCY